MNTTIQVKASDLDDGFIKSVQALYKNEFIEINISTTVDETSYLNKSKANRHHIEKSLKSKNESRFTDASFKKFTKELVKKSTQSKTKKVL